MKNIVKLSLLALMVSLPGFAFAALATDAQGEIGAATAPIVKEEADNTNILATTNYVKGAYNELGKAINGLQGQIDDLNVPSTDAIIEDLSVSGTGAVKAATTWGSTSSDDLQDVNVTVGVTATKKTTPANPS